MRKFRKVLPAVLALGLGYGCTKAPDASVATSAVAPSATTPIEVKTVSPKQQSINWIVDQPATVLAYESAPLVAKLPGYVAKVNVDIGDRVKQSQVLVELSIPELVQELSQKNSLIAQAKAEYTQAARSVDVATARLDVARAGVAESQASVARAEAEYDRWKSELKRVDGLVSQKIVDNQTRDETNKQFLAATAMKNEMLAKVDSAKAAIAEAMAVLGRAKADQDAANAKVGVAEAEAKRVDALLGYSKIIAPFDGVITQRLVHPGHFLQPNSGNRFDPILTIVKSEMVRIAFDIPENAALQVNVGTATTVRVPGLKGKEFSAKIARTSGVLANDSRTLHAEIDLPNTDLTLKPGAYCNVKIALTTPDAFVLPAGAIQYADETTYAYEVLAGKIVKQRIRVGRADAGMIEVVGKKRMMGAGDWESITAAQQFVVGNLGSIADGQAVK